MKIQKTRVRAFTIPTDERESDGTLEWDQTTLVLVEIDAEGEKGLGYTYAHPSVAELIKDALCPLIEGQNPMRISKLWMDMRTGLRNLSTRGLSAMAISAVDNALWDLKARILQVSLGELLGPVRTSVMLYGSGGFCSYSERRLESQLGRWAEEGFRAVKMKIGRNLRDDEARVRLARQAIGPKVDLFIDANGALTVSEALRVCEDLCEPHRVSWFEEPLSSDKIEGLRRIRDKARGRIDIAAGEYAYMPQDFETLLKADCIDVLQADASRCLGLTGFLIADALCQTYDLPLSAHTAPALHAAVCCAAQKLVHLEYFHDHVRIEKLFFDSLPEIREGRLYPDLDRPGNGLILKENDLRDWSPGKV